MEEVHDDECEEYSEACGCESRAVLRRELACARLRLDKAVDLIASIRALLYPPAVAVPDGRAMVFRPDNPHEFMQALSDRIRALPDEMARRGIVDGQSRSPASSPDGHDNDA